MEALQSTYQVEYLEPQQDKNEKWFDLHRIHLDEMTIEVRLYEKRARFAAILTTGGATTRFVLDLIIPTEAYFEEPDQAIEAARAQARKKAWWLDDPEVEYDRKGVPYKDQYYQVCEVLDSVAGEVDQVDVRLRHYPKTVIPQLIYWYAPVGEYRHATTHLMEKIYRDQFSLTKTLGGIRSSLTKQGWDIEFRHLDP